jgi:hypothetical protein
VPSAYRMSLEYEFLTNFKTLHLLSETWSIVSAYVKGDYAIGKPPYRRQMPDIAYPTSTDFMQHASTPTIRRIGVPSDPHKLSGVHGPSTKHRVGLVRF